MKQILPDQAEQIINKGMKEDEEQMKDLIKPVELKTFKAYPIIIAIMAVLQMMGTIFGRKFVIFFGFNIALSSLLFIPATLYTFQVVAECYGWQYARQIVWCNLVVNLLTTLLLLLMKNIPCQGFTHPDLAFSYDHLVNTMWISSCMNCVVVFFADYISTSLISYTKYIFNGRFIIIRILSIHMLSEVILSIGSWVSLPYNGYSIHDTWHIVYNTFFARTISSMIMLPFIIFILLFIQHYVEKVVAFDTNKNFWNLFHWAVSDKDIVHFDYTEWSKLSAEKKKHLNTKKIAVDYYTDEKLGINKIYKNDHIKR